MDWVLPSIDLKVILPEIILSGFALLTLILEPILPKNKKGSLAYLSLIGIATAFIACVKLWGDQASGFNQMVLFDNYANFFNLIFLLGSFLIILTSISYLKREELVHGEYYALILFSTLGMMLMASTLDLIIIFLGLEIMSVCLYILAGFKRDDLKSNESSLKYFLMGAFASGFLLYGIALIYGSTGTTNLEKIAVELSYQVGYSLILFWAGVGLLVVGFGFKIASVPFHMWVPDVYQGAPTPITAFISAGPKAAGFAALLRVFLLAFGDLQPDWSVVFWILSALTMTIGNLIAISQTNIKRMLAYSSIAHAGYILIALVASGEAGISSAMFYLLVYTFMNIGAFAVVIALGTKEKENVNLANYKGLGLKYPWLGIFMAIFMFSLAGMPPTAGFMGKFYIFSAAVKANYVGLVIIGVLNSLISVYYYLRVVVYMFMQKAEVEPDEVTLSFSLSLVLLIAALGVLQLGLFPQKLLNLASDSIFQFF